MTAYGTRHRRADLDRQARHHRQAGLVRISMKIGLGASARFLGTHRGSLRRPPDALIEALADV